MWSLATQEGYLECKYIVCRIFIVVVGKLNMMIDIKQNRVFKNRNFEGMTLCTILHTYVVSVDSFGPSCTCCIHAKMGHCLGVDLSSDPFDQFWEDSSVKQ